MAGTSSLWPHLDPDGGRIVSPGPAPSSPSGSAEVSDPYGVGNHRQCGGACGRQDGRSQELDRAAQGDLVAEPAGLGDDASRRPPAVDATLHGTPASTSPPTLSSPIRRARRARREPCDRRSARARRRHQRSAGGDDLIDDRADRPGTRRARRAPTTRSAATCSSVRGWSDPATTPMRRAPPTARAGAATTGCPRDADGPAWWARPGRTDPQHVVGHRSARARPRSSSVWRRGRTSRGRVNPRTRRAGDRRRPARLRRGPCRRRRCARADGNAGHTTTRPAAPFIAERDAARRSARTWPRSVESILTNTAAGGLQFDGGRGGDERLGLGHRPAVGVERR